MSVGDFFNRDGVAEVALAVMEHLPLEEAIKMGYLNRHCASLVEKYVLKGTFSTFKEVCAAEEFVTQVLKKPVTIVQLMASLKMGSKFTICARDLKHPLSEVLKGLHSVENVTLIGNGKRPTLSRTTPLDLSELKSLKYLTVTDLHKFNTIKFSEGVSLERLTLIHCNGMQSIPENQKQCLKHLNVILTPSLDVKKAEFSQLKSSIVVKPGFRFLDSEISKQIDRLSLFRNV